MKGRRTNQVTFSDPRLLEALSFLAAPREYYANIANKPPSFLSVALCNVLPEHPSVYIGDNSQYPARLELKAALDQLSSIAKILLEGKDGMSRASYIKCKSGFNNALKEIHRIRSEYLPEAEHDNPEKGMFQKFFEGINTTESVAINIAGIILQKMQSQQNSLFL